MAFILKFDSIRYSVLILSLQSVICFFTRSRLYYEVRSYCYAAGSYNLKYVYFFVKAYLIIHLAKEILLRVFKLLFSRLILLENKGERITKMP